MEAIPVRFVSSMACAAYWRCEWQCSNLLRQAVVHVFSTSAEGSPVWTVTLCSGTQSSQIMIGKHK
jgi:hypothetical protein